MSFADDGLSSATEQRRSVDLNRVCNLVFKHRDAGNGEIINYFVSAPFTLDRWTLDSKMNWVLASNINAFARYSILDFTMDSPTAFGPDIEGPGLSGARVGSPGLSFGKTHNIMGSPVFRTVQ